MGCLIKMMKSLRFLTYIFLNIVFFVLIRFVISELNIFINYSVYMLTLIFSFGLWYLMINKNYILVFYFYLMLVFGFMFLRKDVAIIDRAYNFDFYLFEWLRLLDIRIVLFNLVGNLVIFMPLIWFLNYFFEKGLLINLGICILIILLFEWLQAITKKGIFDIVDIILNISGMLLGVGFNVLLKGVRLWNKNQKIKKTEKIMSQN